MDYKQYCQQSISNLGGTDGLGRKIPQYGEVPDRRTDRFVGLFYFLWLGQHSTEGPYDITKILEEEPNAVKDAQHPLWGPMKEFHFWGEPLYDYYLADDAWVLRKHVQLLTNAGIDFLVFDTTNSGIYKKVYDNLFAILDEVRIQGWQVPKFVFYTNTDTGDRIQQIYDDIYKPGRYKELWFNWEEKPLIIGDPEQCSDEIKEFFTFRLNQWPNEDQKHGGFPWIDFVRPQRVFSDLNGNPEVINVSVAQHPSVVLSDTPFYEYGGNWGRNYHDNKNDQSKDAINWGYNFQEQWEFALQQDPKIIFITGWNEWIAMRFEGPPERPVQFIDQATLEFSRDIEPSKNGYKDHYYMQMIAQIRRFKGLSAPLKNKDRFTINIHEPFSQWEKVENSYLDFTNDISERNHPGYGGVKYVNNTGRNDIKLMKITRDDDSLYFYVQTANKLTAYTDSNWMMLLLKTTEGQQDTWEGYDYMLNRRIIDKSVTVLEKSTGGWNWEDVGRVSYLAEGNELQLAVPLKMLNLDGTKPLKFEFKWVDNLQDEGDIMGFYLNGDVAPKGRLTYLYEE
ncbi:hypothetical protein [Bacillus sinesaloumensis]|uniref:hypothetical protein n=1 Tax=Litchfieldia sinesaloumensis TaxID=1926280 RepID=UPI0009886C4F|nr:hypothetical protein [Bacillus sinesaloumensis]